MTDPAVEAANRARVTPGAVRSERLLAEAAAREALRPIRAKWKLLEAEAAHEDAEVKLGMLHVLNAIAPLIYTTEELP